MTEKKYYEIPGAKIEYEIKNDSAYITGYEGSKGELHIPAEIEGAKVTTIEKKSFFNVNGLYRVFLPATIEKIDDWAFSHCKDLEEVFLNQKDYEWGRAVFLECGDLKRICVLSKEYDEYTTEELQSVLGTGALLSATCGILDAPYLFDTNIKNEKEWFRLWDQRLFTILREDDMEGYTQLLLCGEEDYGSDENNLDYFLAEKRKRKVRLAFLRLLYHNSLKEEDESELSQYLLEHTVGCEGNETWMVLKDEHADDVAYISLFLELGCITLSNFDEALLDLGADHPQLKTYILRYKEEKLGGTDFFASLNLDF